MCKLCQGSGNLICFNEGKPEWWNCSCCDGDGTLMLFAAPQIRMSAKQSKLSRKFGGALK